MAAERITLILLAAIAGIVWFLVPHLDYPQGQLGATRFVFAAILGSTVIQVWSLCFDSAIWVSGRIDIRNSIYAIELLVRTPARWSRCSRCRNRRSGTSDSRI